MRGGRAIADWPRQLGGEGERPLIRPPAGATFSRKGRRMTADESVAAREALAGFGVEPSALEQAARSENITFKVEAPGGPYALRLHRPGYNSLLELISERVWTRALSEAGFAVPVGVRASDGGGYVAVALAGGAG